MFVEFYYEILALVQKLLVWNELGYFGLKDYQTLDCSLYLKGNVRKRDI